MLPPRDPDITFLRLRLWVTGEGVNAKPPYVAVAADYNDVSASVLLDLAELRSWHRQLENLHNTLRGEAVLSEHDPGLHVRVWAVGNAGQVRLRVEMNSVAEGHWWEAELDQSFLPALTPVST
jgi:hypothetical protein